MMIHSPQHIFRLSLGVFLLCSFFLASFLFTCIIAVIGLITIPYYWEFLFLAFAFELMYGSASFLSSFPALFFPLIALGVFVFAEILRAYVREELIRT